MDVAIDVVRWYANHGSVFIAFAGTDLCRSSPEHLAPTWALGSGPFELVGIAVDSCELSYWSLFVVVVCLL